MSLQEPPYYSTFEPPVSDSTLVFTLDICILAAILVFCLLNVPRALVFIANNRSEAFQGYLLRSATHFRTYWPPGTTPQSKERGPLGNSPESAATPRQPRHLPMYLSLRNPAASFLQYRVLGNHTVVQVLLVALHTAGVFYVAFADSNNPFVEPGRIGWVIASQIPFVYAFATKNNVIGLLVGVGYEKLNFFHRHVGRLMVIGANVHAIGFIYQWSLQGSISQNIAQPYVRWGMVTLVSFDLLGFFSVQWVRTRYYNLFFWTHAVGLIVALIAASFHQNACIPYVVAGSVCYGLDNAVRAIKARSTTATLRTIPEMGLTRVDIPSLTTGWRPGQHVRLRVLSTAMGLWGMTEVHPFTISSAADTEEGLVLMCKVTGDWTRKLYKMAQTTGSDEQGQDPGRKVKVLIEGPYGGIGDITIGNYSGAMFVVGGSGMTFALSAVQDLVLSGDRSRTQVIEVIWSITDPAALEAFIPLFSVLVSQSSPARLRVSVFYTRATPPSFEGLELPLGFTLTPGRPKIRELLDGFITSMTSKGSPRNAAHGAFVAVCGPVGLSRDVAHAVRACDANSKKAVSGIQFHEEVFGW
ncbi:ferric reductase like transmembrane component-domain-containing protein [Boletus coccyginus]|nr:ferric reductase like transmembrane component-domain-containing protein [Boletus coccyginus]